MRTFSVERLFTERIGSNIVWELLYNSVRVHMQGKLKLTQDPSLNFWKKKHWHVKGIAEGERSDSAIVRRLSVAEAIAMGDWL